MDPNTRTEALLRHLAVRAFLKDAQEGGMKPDEQVAEVATYVGGMDIHPVAVIIARVTYLLALGATLASRKGSVSIPIYLGDAMQLNVRQLMNRKELTVSVPPLPPEHGPKTLEFPDVFCRDGPLFDKAIEAIRAGSEADTSRPQIERKLTRIVEEHYKRDSNKEEKDGIELLGKTFETYDALRIEGRDSVWAYVARNLSRPLAYSAGGGRANVLLGNPPWVAYRHMSEDLKKRFKELANDTGEGEQIYVGGKLATQNDLSALFVARSVGLYLRAGGRLGFVMPLAALTRGQFEKFRSGDFHSAKVAFDDAWTMDDDVWPLFPVPSCVLLGRRRGKPKATPKTVRAYSGSLPYRDADEATADQRLSVTNGAPAPDTAVFKGGSTYRRAFRQGATLVPRMLCLVERPPPTRLGVDRAKPLVRSRRSNQEKKPWKSLPGIESPVEAEFVRPVLLGESILPYRVFRPFEGVIPVNGDGRVLDAEAAADEGYSGLPRWMKAAENTWNAQRVDTLTLIGQFDYYGKLSAQFPVAPLRVVYAASGTLPAATLVRDNAAIVEHGIYWTKSADENEGYFLTAILNSETTRARAETLQARGQFGARHFDKVMFTLPIPRFARSKKLHKQLADAAREAETIAAAVSLPEGAKFQRARKLVRDALTEARVAQRIDALVAQLLDGVS